MKKYNILLACSAGMSTSMLVTQMKKAAKDKDIDAEIAAVSSNEVKDNVESKQIDVLLLGPQVRFMKNDFVSQLEPLGIPVGVIDMMDYGAMNGPKVLDSAISLIEGAE